jgi:quercetin dioxygenase-like cupin family protein
MGNTLIKGMCSSINMGKVVIISRDKGMKVELPNNSYSQIVISDSVVSDTHSTMGFSVFKPNTVTKQIVHAVEELAYVISGSGKIAVRSEAYECKAGDGLYIAAGTPHSVENQDSKDLIMVFYFPHPSYPKTEPAAD